SAAVDVDTVLHEFAHQLDGSIYAQNPALPHMGIINTFAFHDISYDMSNVMQHCSPRRTNDPKDWITKYGFDSAYGCPSGFYKFVEEFADAFSMYVAAGKNFRAAAQQNVTIGKKYEWLRVNVFQGIEYDTDLQRWVESGCTDLPGYEQAQPGYASCA